MCSTEDAVLCWVVRVSKESAVQCGAVRCAVSVCVSRIVRELEVEYRIEYEYADVCGGRWPLVRSFVRSFVRSLYY